ncbi:MAG TPA: D-arabinono-1,4-lactone oxidase [Pyrinomonadaceae bacterium]|nr:D-arabinono-1,4-lactone oxidase [Pyrinomonadaceae bacterium]
MLLSYLKVALTTTLNIVLYALTFGRFIWLEGRVCCGVFRNWTRDFRYRPRKFARPADEAQLASVVRGAGRLRLFGAGHSFNSGVVSDEVLISLDDLSGRVCLDKSARTMTVRGGTRVRDVVRLLFDEGLAFKALPSHDAQSIGGILSTDVHGTGRDWGFVSQLVESLNVMDADGNVKTCRPEDPLFKAAVGGIGAAGVVTEVTVKAVPRFNVEQKVEKSNVRYVEQNLPRLLEENEHLSLYLFPFTKRCQINTWNQTPKARSTLGDLREFISISLDALLASWFGGLMALTGLLPALSDIAHSLKRGSNLVLESNRAFNRTIYHLHQELEFAIPYEQTFAACDAFVRLYEHMYRQRKLPYALFEVRFTPEGHKRTLVGAGRERRSVWIDLLVNESEGWERFYHEAEKLMREFGARPHLGKFCQSYTKQDMEGLHGERFAEFLDVVEAQDPTRKFSNDFTRRLFGR